MDERLWSALRQYRHNNSDEIVFGLDIKQVEQVIVEQDKIISDLRAQLACVRGGGHLADK